MEGTVSEEMEGKRKAIWDKWSPTDTLKCYFARQKPFKSILCLKASTEGCFQQLLLKQPPTWNSLKDMTFLITVCPGYAQNDGDSYQKKLLKIRDYTHQNPLIKTPTENNFALSVSFS